MSEQYWCYTSHWGGGSRGFCSCIWELELCISFSSHRNSPLFPGSKKAGSSSRGAVVFYVTTAQKQDSGPTAPGTWFWLSPCPGQSGIWCVWFLRVLSWGNRVVSFCVGNSLSFKMHMRGFYKLKPHLISAIKSTKIWTSIYIFWLPSLCLTLKQVLYVRLFQITLTFKWCFLLLSPSSEIRVQVSFYMTKIYNLWSL